MEIIKDMLPIGTKVYLSKGYEKRSDIIKGYIIKIDEYGISKKYILKGRGSDYEFSRKDLALSLKEANLKEKYNI